MGFFNAIFTNPAFLKQIASANQSAAPASGGILGNAIRNLVAQQSTAAPAAAPAASAAPAGGGPFGVFNPALIQSLVAQRAAAAPAAAPAATPAAPAGGGMFGMPALIQSMASRAVPAVANSGLFGLPIRGVAAQQPVAAGGMFGPLLRSLAMKYQAPNAPRLFADGGLASSDYWRTGDLADVETMANPAGLPQLSAKYDNAPTSAPAEEPAAPAPQRLSSDVAYERMSKTWEAQQQAIKSQQETLRKQMEEMPEGPDKSELYFKLAAAFAQPTRTGTFGESLMAPAAAMADYAGDARKARLAAKQRREELQNKVDALGIDALNAQEKREYALYEKVRGEEATAEQKRLDREAKAEEKAAAIAQAERESRRDAETRRLLAGNKPEKMVTVIDPVSKMPVTIPQSQMQPGQVLYTPSIAKAYQDIDVKSRGKSALTDTLSQMITDYKTLQEKGGITSTQAPWHSNIGASISGSPLGQYMGGALGTEEKTLRDQINMSRPLVLQSIKEATGMTAQQMNSDRDIQMWMKTTSDPSSSLEANIRQLQLLDQKFGLGLINEKVGGMQTAVGTVKTSPVRSKADQIIAR